MMKMILWVSCVTMWMSFVVHGSSCVCIPAQGFDAHGWVLDSQFMDVMGSPYLLAHGLGVSVADAIAHAEIEKRGVYGVWVRSRNWADGAPGKFKVLVNGKPLAKTFGASQKQWAWESGGEVSLSVGSATVALHDLTGFDGRCAGVVLVPKGEPPPTDPLSAETMPVTEKVVADFVVVGGGVPGTCAAIAAARRGIKTVLIQDRPVLGGNASSEIRVWCGGEARYDLVREVRSTFMNRSGALPHSDARRMHLVRETSNLTVRLSTRAFGVVKGTQGSLAAVKALDLVRNRVVQFEAPLFCDATGDGWVGFWAGADWRMGREAQHEHNETYAPVKADGDTLGASLMWTSVEANVPVPFSAPWAEAASQGEVAVNGEWNWEYGIHRDMIAEGEAIRDRLLLAIYGAFSRAKKLPQNANRMLDFCPFLLGKRESRRLMGDWIYSERDISEHKQFEDAIASGSWSVDLHYDDCKPGVDFLTTCRQPHYGRYWIPYRSIYSRNIPNLFMAGRCFSCTHVGLGGPRVINTLAQLGVAAGEAATLCQEQACTPRGLWEKGLVRKLQDRLGGDFPGRSDPRRANWIIVDDESTGVIFGKGWVQRHNENGEQVGHVSHFPLKGAEVAIYPFGVLKKGRYHLMGRVPYSWQARPGATTAFEWVSQGKIIPFTADQARATGTWRELGIFELEGSVTLRILPEKSCGHVVADGFALVSVDK